jgi:hypothetical protein
MPESGGSACADGIAELAEDGVLPEGATTRGTTLAVDAREPGSDGTEVTAGGRWDASLAVARWCMRGTSPIADAATAATAIQGRMELPRNYPDPTDTAKFQRFDRRRHALHQPIVAT